MFKFNFLIKHEHGHVKLQDIANDAWQPKLKAQLYFNVSLKYIYYKLFQNLKHKR